MRNAWKNAWVCLFVAAMVLLAGVEPAVAESIFGQSYFGNSAAMTDARSEGRGGASFGYTDSLNANVSNPTQLVDLRRVTFTLVSSWGNVNSEDSLGTVKRMGIVNPTLRLAFPMGQRLGLGLGYVARRSTQWVILRDAVVSPDPEFPVPETLEREGTFFDFPFELGVRVLPKLRAGVGFLMVRGTLRQRYSAVLPGAGTNPADVREEVFSGNAVKFGLGLYDLGSLSLTGFYVPEHDMDVDVTVRGVSKDSRSNDTRLDTFPARLGAGGRLGLPGRWSFGLDYRWEGWSSYRGRQAFTGSMEDEWSVHGGLELEEEGHGKRRKAPYRLGGWYRSWNYSLQGETVTEWGVSAGTAIQLAGPYSRLDLAVQYGKVGSLSRNGVQESFLRLVVSITGGEKWY